MGKQQFEVEISTMVTVELDDLVIKAVDEFWREEIYDLKTTEQIAEHIAYNLVINNAKLSSLDGWANLSDDNARIVGPVDWEVKAQ